MGKNKHDDCCCECMRTGSEVYNEMWRTQMSTWTEVAPSPQPVHDRIMAALKTIRSTCCCDRKCKCR